MKSIDRGDTWTEASPDLTTNNKAKMPTGKGGDGNIEYGTITALEESPVAQGVIWAGTDDGNVWVTKDGGKNWTKLNDNIKGNPRFWVSKIEPSPHAAGTAYVAYIGFRQDDERAFLYKTTDFGQTWTSVVGNLPNKMINVVREDPRNPNLLFVGVNWGLYASIDGGKTWNDMHGNMSTQPVYDLKIHPREHELIVGTHGRGVFITDISALEELDATVLGQDVFLFEPKPTVKWVNRRDNVSASINFGGQSAPNGMMIRYFLKAAAAGDVTVQVLKGARVVAETKGPNAAGLNQVLWTLSTTAPQIPGAAAAQGGGRGFGGGGGGMGGGRGGGAQAAFPSFGGTIPAAPGEYTLIVKAGTKTLSKRALVLEDVWFDKQY
jgi:photosystem II stability/assembly factor-like uncharacterized protein